MSEHPTPPPADQPPSSTRFFTWLRGLGITRSNDRWFAGVAAGIAERAGIDPLIVRGVFVVLAILGGPGILLYLAGWLLLPDATGKIHVEELVRGRASGGVIAISITIGLIVLLPLTILIFRGLFTIGPFGWLWGELLPAWLGTLLAVLWWAVVVPGLIIWLLVWYFTGRGTRGGPPHQHRSESSSDDSSTHAREDWTTKEYWNENLSKPLHDSWEQTRSSVEAHRARQLGAAHLVLSFALALIGAGIAATWAYTQTGFDVSPLTAGLVVGVAVLSLSMIVAGVRGRYSGWVGFTAFVGVLALLFTPVIQSLPENTHVQVVGNYTLSGPAGEYDPQGLVIAAGNARVDLSALRPEDAGQEFSVFVLAGNSTVILPDDHSVVVHVEVAAGRVIDTGASADEELRGVLLNRTFTTGGTGTIDSTDKERTSEIDGAHTSDADRTVVNIRLFAGNVYLEGAEPSRTTAHDIQRSTQR